MVVAVPARVRRLARDQGWGKPVARYHTIRPLSGILPMLLIVLAGRSRRRPGRRARWLVRLGRPGPGLAAHPAAAPVPAAR
jgi:hypothetical protein